MTQRDGRRRQGLRALLAACLGALALAAPGAVALSTQSASSGPLRVLSSPAGNGIVRIGGTDDSAWAPVITSAAARFAPSATARVVGRLTTKTPEGTTMIVPALRRAERGGRLWVEVGLPVLPNGTTGWVERSTLGGYRFVSTRLEVSLRTRTAALYRSGKRIFSARVGVGQARWPTPTGTFLIRNKLTQYASASYGPVAFGMSARSAVLTDWPAGGFIGIHGTNQPGLIPGRISHGCIRLRNGDILRLARLMPLGTPVTVR